MASKTGGTVPQVSTTDAGRVNYLERHHQTYYAVVPVPKFFDLDTGERDDPS